MTDKETIANDWPVEHVEQSLYDWGDSEREPFRCFGVSWRILLTDVAPVYEYCEGEMWVSASYEFLADDESGVLLMGGAAVIEIVDTLDAEVFLHRRAAIVCDGAEQFRALYEARG